MDERRKWKNDNNYVERKNYKRLRYKVKRVSEKAKKGKLESTRETITEFQ
jgi:hypothetical protein